MPRFRNPTPGVPVPTYPTPDITDQVLIEFVTSEFANSHPLDPGTPHSNSRDWPNFKLGKQEVHPQDENWFLRYWVMDQPTTGTHNRDTWNYAIQFSKNNNLSPLIFRAYRIPKAGYLPLDKGSLDPSSTPNTYLISEEAKQFDPTSEFYADYFNVIRVYETLPGPFICTTRIDDDGAVVNICTRRNLCTDIVDGELPITDGVWTKTTRKGDDSQVCEEVVETRDLPGNPMVGTKLDKYGNAWSIVKTLKDTSTVSTTDEITVGNVWVKTYKEPVSDLVCWEIVEALDLTVAADNYLRAGEIDGDEEVVDVAKRLRPEVDVATSATESFGTITETRKNEVNKLVSEEEVRTRLWLDKAIYSLSIPNLIPEWARPQIPTVIESHIVAGTATVPTLGPREFQRTERQLDKLLFERRVEKIRDIEFPVTAVNTQTSEQYGGEVLEERLTLDEAEMTADEGFLVVSSETSTLAVYDGPSPLGLFMKRTLINPGSVWPTLVGDEFDEETQIRVITETEVVDPSYSIVSAAYTVENTRPIDQWRIRRIKVTKDVSAINDKDSALISYSYNPFQFPGTLDYNRYIIFGHGEGYRRASALLSKHTNRTWWINSSTPPTVGNSDLGTFDVDVKEIITDTVNVPIFSSFLAREQFRDVVHDDITNNLGAFYPATIPSFTEYYLGTGAGPGGTFNIYQLTAYGSGYAVGDILTVCSDSVTVTAVGLSNSITGYTLTTPPPAGVIITGATDGGPCSASGGSGSGATFEQFVISYDTTTPGTAWVRSEKTIAAQVKYTDIPNLWKVETQSVVMR